ncbi:MAG TPA: hypothetical protein VK689_18660, partial [Armatimonadota bacterium]|nr:hypothetical protein [Armatimonadota bacterium]
MNQQRTTSPHLRPSLDGSADRLAARPALVHPAFRRLPPPLIVLGMHRSGTSVVAGILARLGVYMGPE